MPNTHFGEIGDVWKHLPLATLLTSQQPGEYWETHSGSPLYPLLQNSNTIPKELNSRWWKIDFGVLHYFLSNITQKADPCLQRSDYTAYLKKYANHNDNVKYPLTHTLGSAAVAMFSLRSPQTKFVFCDIVRDDLVAIREQSKQWIPDPDNTLDTHCGDGIDYIYDKITLFRSAKCVERPKDIFIFIDPFQTALKSEKHKISSLDLFGVAAECGFKVALWYCFEASTQQTKFQNDVMSSLNYWKSILRTPTQPTLWCGEIVFKNIDHMTMNPGISGGIFLIPFIAFSFDLSLVSFSK